MIKKDIVIKGARTNNLKDIQVKIPKNQISLFVGVSGSGKTSLVFDTIAAEAQRQMNETYPSFVRNRLPHYGQPEIDVIENLSPVVVVNQKSMGENSRSTVGTATDINPTLRLLFSRFGEPYVGFSDMFSFNSPVGMCQVCEGLGKITQFKMEELINPQKSLNEGAINFPTFEPGSYRWKRYVDSGFFDNDKKLEMFSPEEMQILLYSKEIKPPHPTENWYKSSLYEGLIPRIIRTFIKNPSKAYRKYDEEVERITYTQICSACSGHRLNSKALKCKIQGKHIGDCMEMELTELRQFLTGLSLPGGEEVIARLLQQLSYLCQIGLGYLSLSRETSTISGGEAQRIKLVRYIGSSLTDMLYILDEPSVGLHPHDIQAIRKLIKAIHHNGNTVLIIDHDIEIIRLADTVFELGPLAGNQGGEIINVSSFNQWLESVSTENSIPRKKKTISFENEFKVEKLHVNNLQNVTTKVPQSCLVAITGVAGSGKSSFAKGVAKSYPNETLYVNQKSIRGSRRSTIATYVGIFDAVRQLFARENKIDSGYFSFNGKGACPTCKGKGFLETELAFLETTHSVCEECQGKKYPSQVLSYSYRGKSISDVLQFSIEEGELFFRDNTKIASQLLWLKKLGLGYLKLGQTLDTLSGGELQRLKLSLNLHQQNKLFILDEPTTGLSSKDVSRLVDVFDELIGQGNTVLIIEHNMDLIRQADWMIDFGPGSGKKGGRIVYEGVPEKAKKASSSITGGFL